MSIEANTLSWNIGKLCEENKKKRLSFDFSIQRGLVWDTKKDSELIHSILYQLPLPEFLLNKKDRKYQGLDGKQRNNAIYNYCNDKYPLKLSAEFENIEYEGESYKVAGKSFKELPEELQNLILRTSLKVSFFDNLNPYEMKLVFKRINNGRPISPAELARIDIQSRDVFNRLLDHPVMTSKNVFSEIKQRKMVNSDVIEDVWITTYNQPPNLVNNYRKQTLAENEVTTEQEAELMQALDFLQALTNDPDVSTNKALMKTIRGKINLESLIYAGVLASRQGTTVEDYIAKARAFFTPPDGETGASISESYNAASQGGTSKTSQIEKRMMAIEETFA